MRHPITTNERSATVGRRATVRRRLHGESYPATDVIGVVESWEHGTLTVRLRTGELLTIADDDLIAVKVVPPRTITRRQVRDLEAAAAQGWQGAERETIGSWLLRAARGFTGRANSCLPLGDPGHPLDAAVEAVEQWYAERGLRPAFQVPEPLEGGLGAVLDAAGWPAAEHPTLVMTAPVGGVTKGRRGDLPVARIDAAPDDAWLAGYHYRGGTLPPHAIEVLLDARTVGFANIDIDGRRVAIARGAVTTAPSGRRWLGVTAVEVDANARRRGLGSHVVGSLAAWAVDHEATDVFLQVADDNTAAQATYGRLGFVEHHRYHYRRR